VKNHREYNIHVGSISIISKTLFVEILH